MNTKISEVRDLTKLNTESLKPGDVIIHENEIQERINELAQEIATEYKGKNILMVGLLNGSTMFMSDMMKALYKAGLKDIQTDYMKVSSYGKNMESSGIVNIESNISVNPKGRHVIVVDDILDSGFTIFEIRNHFKNKRLASFATLALVEKTPRRTIMPLGRYTEYIGFKIPDVWIEGYGMDSYGLGRANPNIVVGPTVPAPASM